MSAFVDRRIPATFLQRRWSASAKKITATLRSEYNIDGTGIQTLAELLVNPHIPVYILIWKSK